MTLPRHWLRREEAEKEQLKAEGLRLVHGYAIAARKPLNRHRQKERHPTIETTPLTVVSSKPETDIAAQPVAKVEKLEDYGEKIGGAKKDLARKLAEITGNDIISKPLSKT